MMEIHWSEVCGACVGRGYQRNQLTDMNEPCPVCNGSGRRCRSNYDDLPPGVYCSCHVS
mgnify:CR=1 FL=1